MNAIDERALESLSFISTLANQLTSNERNISKYFPYFVWLIRDFSLDLTTKNNKEVFTFLSFYYFFI